MKTKGNIIAPALIGVLLTVALFTVVNKRWWQRIINKRWQYQFTRDSESESGYAFRAWHPDMSRYSYAQLARWYFRGDDGWFRTEDEYLAWAQERQNNNAGPGYNQDLL